MDLQKENERLKAELKQAKLTIARQAESYQDEMARELGYIQKKIDQLKEKIQSYDSVINYYKEQK